MKNILILVIGSTGNEPEALRQALEYFGYFVATKYIGRPNDLISVLKGDLLFDPDCIIISCHGEDGEIIMPVLGDDVYEPDEPKGNITASDIDKYLKLKDKLILNLGCTTGKKKLAKAFSKKKHILHPMTILRGMLHCILPYHCFTKCLKVQSWTKHIKQQKQLTVKQNHLKFFGKYFY